MSQETDPQAEFEKYQARAQVEMYQSSGLRGGPFYWALGQHIGKTVLLGPYSCYEDANNKGLKAFEGPFKVFPSSSRDRSRVTQAIKEGRLGQGSNLTQALERIGHQI